MNERITESIFRNHVQSDGLFKNKKIVLEEQSSSNSKIDKLLKHASKSGDQKGYPDFIVQYKEDSNIIIVIECKAKVTQHESEDRKQYKEYAVDGVLLYSSFLSKEYDVIAIAVSGNNKRLRISHFLQLKGSQNPHKVFTNDKFLEFKDYLDNYKKDDRKFHQDFHQLLLYSKDLNLKLHSLKIRESERSLLISGILIALQDKAFQKSYKLEEPQPLTKFLLRKIEEKLQSVRTQYVTDIITSYSFIKTHTILSKKSNELKNIIDDVDSRINRFIRTYQYIDTIGQFYIEFLKYSNNDKSLGIVLTPPHITELFCEIANVNINSIVLDTCTGTGGFLISAMKKMVLEAGGDRGKEKCIKEKQIIGIENQHDIYTLLCSNMFIHGDGRSNLIKGSCFDEESKNKVRKFKPNVGFLNPPYHTNKNDRAELEFVLNNLEQLEKGSYCVSILPLSCVTETNKNKIDLKKKILENHCLEAVFSMPNELFKNSEVGTCTCILVIKAKEPHHKGYKSYFAYWKDDGFYYQKTNGRADYDNKWKDIKNIWLTRYRNKENHPGHSITKEVNYKEEWCSESYMLTDYSVLQKDNFLKVVKNFVIFSFKNSLIEEVKKEPKSCNQNNTIEIDSWKTFKLVDLFNIEGSKSFTKKQINDYGAGKHPYVVTSSENNGIQGFYNHSTERGNVLTIDSATVGSCFYQPLNFCASDHVEKLVPRFTMNTYTALFLKTVIDLEKFRYGYGRKFAQIRIKQTEIKLPAIKEKNGQYKPDWSWMENYIKSLPYSNNLI